ncbi:Spermatogenesis-associated protein 5 [Chionoecetes opilio]|uniref:Spermatogenesis-associated protein 5 n=1 Tax=Chionoecetes opilio TaxID=41210 RepID=A0A8J5D5R2_CHIOP|nr:Spermatogenesis-associated protein 5 [Chionoecetes opilio]
MQKMAVGNTPSRQSKRGSAGVKMSTKVTFLPYESLQAKTRDKLSNIHSLVVAMVPAVAAKRGFSGPYVTLAVKEKSLPAMLLLDKHVKENVAFRTLCDGLSEGEDVTVTPGCPSLLAEEVTFSILSLQAAQGTSGLTQYLKEQLVYSGLVLSSGMEAVVQYLSQDVTLKVDSVKMFGLEAEAPFTCIHQTRVCVQAAEVSARVTQPEVTFKDIGGYDSELESMHQQIDALFSQESPKRNTVKGILISGPSGCGKTLIGKALKAKYGKKFLLVPLDDVKSKYLGETEQNLSQYFAEAAKRSPCLLFMDDLDLLCGSRDKGGSTGVVTALLHLMDGVTGSAEGVMVVASATQPQSLDAALRRPGRLSHDVCLGVPGPPHRRAILHNLLQGLPSGVSEAELSSLADITHGYFGGDLRSVVVAAVTEAGRSPLTRRHLEEALAHTRPALVKDSVSSSSGIKLCNISGYSLLKAKLHEAVSLTLRHGSIFKTCGFSPPSRFLLFGPPGCGKSTLVSALASEFHLSVIPVKRSTVLGKYFGESEQNLAKIFQQASDSSPCIIHFENFEGLAGGRRSREGGGDAESRVVNHLKVQLDGIVQNEGVFVFAETNRPDLLNKVSYYRPFIVYIKIQDVIRPGRFHEYHRVDLPSSEDRRCILEDHLPPLTLTEEVTLHSLVTQTERLTVAELLQVCEEVRLVGGGSEGPDTTLPLPPSFPTGVMEVVEAAIPNTSLKLLQKYRNFAKIYCSDS